MIVILGVSFLAVLALGLLAILVRERISKGAFLSILRSFDTRKRDWPEDAAHENGNYLNRCWECNETFMGYKRRTTCRRCSLGEN